VAKKIRAFVAIRTKHKQSPPWGIEGAPTKNPLQLRNGFLKNSLNKKDIKIISY
jgi:hypothetical protein